MKFLLVLPSVDEKVASLLQDTHGIRGAVES